MAGQTVIVSVLADTKKFGQDFNNAGKKAGGLSKAFKVAAVGVGIAAVAVGGFVASSIKAAADLEKIAAQTNAVIASTGGAAGKTAKQIDALAGKLSLMSGVDDEVIKKSQNLLLTFTKIQGTTFDAATKTALDMSVALGQDLNASSILVGKALNDPIKGLTALTRVGVGFTEQQKAQITAMEKAGDTAGAQAVILEELQRQFGGSAAAFGTTYEGAVGKVRSLFGDLQQMLGAAFLPAVTGVLNTFAGALSKMAENPAFQSMLTSINNFVTGLLSGKGAMSGLVSQIAPLLSFFSPFGLILKAITPVLPVLIDGLKQVGAALGGALMTVLPSVTSALGKVVDIFSGALAKILPKLIPVIVTLAGVIGGVLVAVLPTVEMLLDAVVTVLDALMPVLMPIIEHVLNLVNAFAPLIGVLLSLIGPLLEPLIELLVAILVPILDLIAPLLELLVPALKFVAEALANVIKWVVDAIKMFVGLITGSEEAKAGIKKVWEGILDFFAGIPKAIGDFFAGAAKWLVGAGKNIIDGLLKGIRNAVDGLFRFIGDIGKNIAKTFRNVLGIASPSRVFKGFGGNVIKGLELGLAGSNRIGQIMDGITRQVSGGFAPELAAPGGYRAGVGNTYNVTVHAVAPNAEVGRAVVAAIEDYERIGGKR